ncbi:MAG: hypothetical protein KF871_08545 [Hydrogenophaga sp.]|uniref:COG4648 family protein n=1 Tax=Hydrogenophaga sp. TaxID=1904254 RepID=UPI001DE3B653|nr:hypothetical protein [Hydrogenophaga sp.]MBX3609934.1 hypothetical protein [Hydrogenophaga sp.]
MNALGWLRTALVGLLLLAWMLASHLGSIGKGPADLNAAVAIAPVLLAFGIVIARTCAPVWRVVLWLLCLALLWALWPVLRTQIALLHYLPHLGVHLALAAWFGASLRGDGDPLITRFARHSMGQYLSPAKLRYTRQATLAWTLYFVINAAVSTGLFLWAPREVWSVYGNMLTGPLVGLMFVLDALWRRVVLPPHERPTLKMVVQSYRQDLARRRATREPT